MLARKALPAAGSGRLLYPSCFALPRPCSPALPPRLPPTTPGVHQGPLVLRLRWAALHRLLRASQLRPAHGQGENPAGRCHPTVGRGEGPAWQGPLQALLAPDRAPAPCCLQVRVQVPPRGGPQLRGVHSHQPLHTLLPRLHLQRQPQLHQGAAAAPRDLKRCRLHPR